MPSSPQGSSPATCHPPCSDAEHGERAGDPRPRYGEALCSEWVDYIRPDAPQSMYAALNKLWAHQPVLLQGTLLVAGLAGRWSLQQLVRRAGEQELEAVCQSRHNLLNSAFPTSLPLQAQAVGPQPQLPVLCSDARRNRFIEADAAKNVYGRCAGVHVLLGDDLQMPSR